MDCATDLDADAIEAIRQIWLERLVVFFPDQQLDDDTQIVFARRFGELTENHPVEQQVVERKEIHSIESGKDRTDFWHTDITFMKRPAMASLLRSVVVPEAGGDTMWADTRAAYESWPNRSGDCATNFRPSTSSRTTPAVAEGHGNVWEGKKLDAAPPGTAPVVRVHPETGHKNLFVNPKFTIRVTDMPEEPERRPASAALRPHDDPTFVVRYHWKPGTLAFWDNRATMHFGIFDYEGERRVMHRVTLRGERPVGPATRSD